MVGDVLAADGDGSLVDFFETGEHPQRRRLSAAGRADEDEEFTILDVEIELVDGSFVAAGKEFGDALECDGGHDGGPFTGRNVPDDPSKVHIYE